LDKEALRFDRIGLLQQRFSCCSGIAAGASYAAVSQLALNSWLLLIIGIIFFLPILILSFLLTRTFTDQT
jgi:hypothetical protein